MRSKRLLSVFFMALVVLTSSVFSFGAKAYAEDLSQPRPLAENTQIIQQQSDQVNQKATLIQNTAQEILSLEQKKQSLADQLTTEQKNIDDLKQKLADKQASAAAEQKRLDSIKNMFVHVTSYASGSAGNLYDAGQCTWYVKNRRPDLPNNLGNANTWYSMAAADGYNVGAAPKKGAVGTTTRGYAGHVVYVEGVSLDGQTITISEMNYAGPYSLRTRSASASEFVYIYELN